MEGGNCNLLACPHREPRGNVYLRVWLCVSVKPNLFGAVPQAIKPV